MIIKKICCEKKLSFKDKFFMSLYRQAQDYINNKMDVINYLSFIKEYTHLKCLLFEDVPSMCLSFTQNPKLYEHSRFTKLNKDNKDMIEKIVKFYVSNKHPSEQEKKLYELLSDDIKEIIIKLKS
jgi:hypothetical protein